MIDKQHAYVLVRDRLGESPRLDRDAALAELARRYLAGHAPASDRDLAKWSGLPPRVVRLRGRGVGSARMPAPRLLGAFDPTLVG